jgi:hypothetical protein
MHKLIWTFLLFTLQACASFANVKATAQLGQAIGNEPVDTTQWVAECLAPYAGPTDSRAARCLQTDYAQMVAGVHDASLLIATYATALASAADGKDVITGSDFTTALATLTAFGVQTGKPAAEVGTIINAAIGLVSQFYREHAIANTVLSMAPQIDELARRIELEIDSHLKDVRNARDNLSNSISTGALPNSLALAVSLSDARIASLHRLLAAWTTFQQAHDKLAQQIKDNKPWKNGELLEEITKAVVKTIQQLSTDSASH